MLNTDTNNHLVKSSEEKWVPHTSHQPEKRFKQSPNSAPVSALPACCSKKSYSSQKYTFVYEGKVWKLPEVLPDTGRRRQDTTSVSSKQLVPCEDSVSSKQLVPCEDLVSSKQLVPCEDSVSSKQLVSYQS
ncbi:hypothetical protein HF521_021302 [Silurus meridionalis]|uniref:Uncharacterized protein n=1 Tax=Silurus meridionalis TaxID=175797 RepID=A0A8T0BFP5_SILME|nr:hypothetical protein HF521_021302 [Silurus meridionalis]